MKICCSFLFYATVNANESYLHILYFLSILIIIISNLLINDDENNHLLQADRQGVQQILSGVSERFTVYCSSEI